MSGAKAEAPPTAAALQSPSDPPFSALHPALRPHAGKVTTAALAVAQVRAGDHVFVGTACATPRALVAALEELALRPADVELMHFLTDRAVPHNTQGEAVTNFRHRSFFVGANMCAAVKQGIAD